jgi:hypothetical protein
MKQLAEQLLLVLRIEMQPVLITGCPHVAQLLGTSNTHHPCFTMHSNHTAHQDVASISSCSFALPACYGSTTAHCWYYSPGKDNHIVRGADARNVLCNNLWGAAPVASY